MPKFRRIAPQAVEHEDGWRVQVADRYHVEVVDGGSIHTISADLDGPIIRLRVEEGTDPAVVQRIVDGLEAMGEAVSID